MLSAVRGTGQLFEIPPGRALDARLAAADRPGEHLWTVLASWVLQDPERPSGQLDAENLIVFAGPGCFKCEREYSRKLARQPCTGRVS